MPDALAPVANCTPAFLACVGLVVGVEKGLVDDPADPGGLTKYGISQRSYPTLDIRNLTQADAQGLYWRDFFVPAGCDTMPVELAYVVFDSAVNNGLGAAGEMLQESLNYLGASPQLTVDGGVGDSTRGAIARMLTRINGAQLLMTEFNARRTFLMGSDTSQWAHDGLGWSRRLAALPYQALALKGAAA